MRKKQPPRQQPQQQQPHENSYFCEIMQSSSSSSSSVREFDSNTKEAINTFFMDNNLLPPHKMPNSMERIDKILEDPMSIAPENTKHISDEDIIEFKAMRKFKETRKEQLVPFNAEKISALNAIMAEMVNPYILNNNNNNAFWLNINNNNKNGKNNNNND